MKKINFIIIATILFFNLINCAGYKPIYSSSNINFKIVAELVLIAMGFTNPQHEGLLNDLKLNYDDRGNVKANEKMQSNIDKIFTCGDMHRGQSLVVHAIASGRKCARNIDVFLEGKSSLPSVQEYIRSM